MKYLRMNTGCLAKAVMMLLICICVLICSSPTALADPNPAQLILEPTGSTYVEENQDDWISETSVTSQTSFNLSIYCCDVNSVPDVDYLHLLVASNIIDDDNFTVSINGNAIDLPNEKMNLTDYGIDYKSIGNGGIYPAYYSDVNLSISISKGETVEVPVVITLVENALYPKVHFDAAGVTNGVMVLKNSNSNDAAYNVPEFPTVMLPVLSILGLMFILSRKRK